MKTRKWREKLKHETEEFLSVFLVVAPFFLSFVTYRIFLSGDTSHDEFEYGTAIFNALVLSKIILIGEWAGLGARSQNRALIASTIHKSAMFTLFYMAFHVLESLGHALLESHSLSAAFHAALVEPRAELLGRALVMFFAFIPFFALWEVRRVMGADQFRSLFLHGRRTAAPSEVRHAESGEQAA